MAHFPPRVKKAVEGGRRDGDGRSKSLDRPENTAYKERL
jgi:hypothetical protein